MKTIFKRSCSVLLALLLLASVLSGLSLMTFAAADYNSGVQGKVCTSLSSSAKSYYGTGYDYATLSKLTGTALEAKLRERMANGYNGTYSYSSLGTLFKHTDAYNGSSSKYHCFYSNTSITNTMNREHVWPKSLAPSFGEDGEDTGTGGADVLHLRPADNAVNSTRSNKAFGYVRGGTYYTAYTKSGAVGGYYNGGYFEPLDATKGDAARIILYVYTRWQERDLSKVFQSKELLLKWCEQDPVDEYEMQRNDICQQYVNSRNVYVDYPEYCWLVLGKAIPTHMTTPSGNAKTCNNAQYEQSVTKPATCTQDGVMTYTCKNCGYSYTETIPATGHHYQNGVCIDCGAVAPTGTQYVLTDALKNGDKVMIYNTGMKRVLGAEQTSYNGKAQITSVSGSVSDSILKVTGTGAAILTVSVKGSGSNIQYAFKNESGKYLACETANELSYITSAANTAYWIVEDSGNGTFYIKNSTTKYNGYSEQYLEVISNNFTTYGFTSSKESVFAMQFYKQTEFAGCDHDYKVTASKAPTCTEAGSTTYTCSKCGDSYTTYSDALGHDFRFSKTVAPTETEKGYDLYICTRCSAEEQRNFTNPTGGDPQPGDNPFVDVPADEWYTKAVLWATSTDPKVTAGVDETHFAPDKKCTRCEVVQFLWNAAGKPEVGNVSNPFSDVQSGDWFYSAVMWAVANNITSGTTPTTFSPNKVCNRAEVVTFLWNAHGKPAPESQTIPFSDVPGGEWYTIAVLWAIERKVTSGTGDGTTFSPTAKCTRAQIVTFLYKDQTA